MAERTRYVVDTDALTEQQRIDACRLVLAVTADDIGSFATDIPWSAAADWPDDVRRAAEILGSRRAPSRGENAGYRRSGEIRRDDEEAWDAFVTFAPYAYDASAWTGDSHEVVELADAAGCVLASLTPEQLDAVSRKVGAAAVVPLEQRRKRDR